MLYLVVRDRETQAVREFYWLGGEQLRASANVMEFVIRRYAEGIVDGGKRWLPKDGREFLKHLARVRGSTTEETATLEQHDKPPIIAPEELDTPETDPGEYTDL